MEKPVNKLSNAQIDLKRLHIFSFILPLSRSTMTEVVSGLQRTDPNGGGAKVAVSVDDTIKIVEDLTRIH